MPQRIQCSAAQEPLGHLIGTLADQVHREIGVQGNYTVEFLQESVRKAAEGALKDGKLQEAFQEALCDRIVQMMSQLLRLDARGSTTAVLENHAKLRSKLQTPVSDLHLTDRAFLALRIAGIHVLRDLVEKYPFELEVIPNFPLKALEAITFELRQRGLYLGMKVDNSSILAQGIDILHLSIRARNCMRSLGVQTVGSLVEHSPASLLRCRNFGPVCLSEVEEKLQEYGLHLQQE